MGGDSGDGDASPSIIIGVGGRQWDRLLPMFVVFESALSNEEYRSQVVNRARGKRDEKD